VCRTRAVENKETKVDTARRTSVRRGRRTRCCSTMTNRRSAKGAKRDGGGEKKGLPEPKLGQGTV